MAQQTSVFSFIDGYVPDESNELKFAYDPAHPGRPVKVTFPSGNRTLSGDKLAELGILCVALGGTTETENIFELLEGFELPAPFFLHMDMLIHRMARRIAKSLLENYPLLENTCLESKKSREEFEDSIVNEVTRVVFPMEK
jgi:hypothetical protein